ncbi:phosphoglucosamine mutase [bacterium]|nr:phosphoglucosamine mutase [bacterium]
MATLMTGVAGVRGVVGDGLTPEVVARYGAAFGTWLKGGRVVVGGDTRPSRHMVRSALFSGLIATGCEVIDLGLATTPTIELMVEHLEASGGICVTASHNPTGWNAMKFLDNRGRFLGPDEGGELNDLVESGQFDYVDSMHLGKVVAYEGGGVEHHIRKILDDPYVDVATIRRRQFRVGVDAINSVGNMIMPNLLHELGCDLRKVHGELNGDFAREAEPLAQNLGDLSNLVSNEGMDIGLALDPDGDRLAIIDEQGQPIGEELTLALAVKRVLQLKPGPVVCNLSTTRAVEDIAQQFGVPCYRTPVGEAHVAMEMDARDSIIGGEGNGGVMLATVHSNRDAMVGTALILSLMAEAGEPLSVLVSRLPKYTMLKRKAPAKGVDATEMRARIRGEFGESAAYDERDGIRVDLPEGWVHVRLSNTEPIVRIFSEAKNRDDAQTLADRATEAMKGNEA